MANPVATMPSRAKSSVVGRLDDNFGLDSALHGRHTQAERLGTATEVF